MRFVHFFIFISLSLALSACGGGHNENGTPIPEEDFVEYSNFDMNFHPLTKTICDPFTEQESESFHRGIRASLYSAPSGSNFSSVQDYFDLGDKQEQTLFLSQMNVPTRRFEKGFINAFGEAILDDGGEVLIEDFALDMRTIFKLGKDQAPGRYEISVLADDGVVWEFRDQDGKYKELINEDGIHMTRMGCSSVALDLNESSEVPMRIKYYQGPRHHIALVAMMRKLNDGEEPGGDKQCGKQGNKMFFDYTQGSAPKKAYTDLMERGWKVIPAENFNLPLVFSYNPCTEGDRPDIYDVAEKVDENGDVTVSWKTKAKSSSQLLVNNLENNDQHLVESDNILRFEHEIKIKAPGLDAKETSLEVKPVSMSHNLGREVGPSVYLND